MDNIHDMENHPLIPVDNAPRTITLVMADRPPGRAAQPHPPAAVAMGFGAQNNPQPPMVRLPDPPNDRQQRPAQQNLQDDDTPTPSTCRSDTLVMLAVDLSDKSDFAFDHYVRHLHRPENHLVFVHSLESPFLDVQVTTGGLGATASYVTSSQDHLGELLQQKKESIAEIRRHFEQKLQAHPLPIDHCFHITKHTSSPGDALVDVIRKIKPSYVVMGSGGLTAFKRTVLGSVSHHVLHYSNVPVFICHQNSEAAWQC